MWWSINVEDVSYEKALTLWINSSLGVSTILAQRTSTEGGWVAMKKADLGKLPILDPRQLTEAQVKGLADAEFERLPGMADCPARTALDEGMSEILGLPDLRGLRVLLASEPVVCGVGL